MGADGGNQVNTPPPHRGLCPKLLPIQNGEGGLAGQSSEQVDQPASFTKGVGVLPGYTGTAPHVRQAPSEPSTGVKPVFSAQGAALPPLLQGSGRAVQTWPWGEGGGGGEILFRSKRQGGAGRSRPGEAQREGR